MSRLILMVGGCLLWLLPLQFQAQNLVLNPSFESYTSCPLGPSEFDKAINWSNPFINFPSVGDTCSTSDLYNTCSPFGSFGVGVPNNILGSEAARTGNGYAGIILLERFGIGCSTFFGTNWREYVQGTLSSPLSAGQDYCVTFYVSLADNVNFATDDIGVNFSSSQHAVSCIAMGGAGPLPVTPQLNWAGGNLTSATGWTELQWPYTASGGEQFITIGNFKGDGTSSFICPNSGAFNPYAYYYIEDVSVVPGSCILPVSYESLWAYRETYDNVLNWETAEETQVSHFIVEASPDGEDFDSIGTVPAYNARKGGNYSFVDKTPAMGPAWYRLVAVDIDGTRRLSKIVELSDDTPGERPELWYEGNGYLYLEGSMAPELQILDLQGRLIRSYPLGPDLGRKHIQLEGLPAGLYLARAGHEAIKIRID